MDEHVEEISLPANNQSLRPDGTRFPAAFVPRSSNGNSLGELLELIRNNREVIKDQVVARGALLFRGWQVNDGKEFAEVVDALSYNELSYEHGGAPRKHVAGSMYTANESPVERALGFHNEMAYLPQYPDVIVFYCETPSPQGQGGGTGLLDGKHVYDCLVKKMPDFVRSLEEHKVEYSGPIAWQSIFKTSDKDIAQSRAAEDLQARLEWDAEENAILHRGPFTPTLNHPVTGATLWFNSIGLVTTIANQDICLGDGSLVPLEDVEACVGIYTAEQVVVQWEKGDFVIVDNLSVMHSRVPGQPPRVIHVALGIN